MVGLIEAKQILAEHVWKLPSEMLLITEAIERVVKNDVTAPIDVPSFNNSAMDGYAFCFNASKTEYVIFGSVQAGERKSHYVSGNDAARIFTGAPIPAGADTVIPQELVSIQDNKITFKEGSIQSGANVRLRGAQCKTGEIIVKAGTVITPGVVALLSSVGIRHIQAYRQPKVKIIVTGNELVETGTPLLTGEIYNSNQPALLAYLKAIGINDAEAFHVKDNVDELRQVVSSAIRNSDVLITVGGISVGEYDFVFQALSDEGVEPLFYKIRQKPGKPMFAGKIEKTMVFALPGNPAAVVSCFNQYVKPCLQYMRGIERPFSASATLPLAHPWEKKGELANILKAVVINGEVNILHGQDSFNLLPFADVNAFALLHENDKIWQKGDLVEVFYW
ncbi:MAG: molybdopterin molybdotransferase MoeA [Bacteroidetes bacterium]|nr:molybdopterin molybdotransferase MoeA [Bacteroidota bacterium]